MGLPEKKVKQLLGMMNAMSTVKIPEHKAVLECFDLAMDEQMLDYLLKVGTEPHTVPQLEALYHEMYHGDIEAWEAWWTELMAMCFVHPRNNDDRVNYILAPFFPGWIEMSVGGPLNPKREAILRKFFEFWEGSLIESNTMPIRFLTNLRGVKKVKDGVPARMKTLAIRGEREITLNQPLESRQEVYPTGSVFALLEEYKDEIAVLNCFCRQFKKINTGEDCNLGLPIEGCMALGAIASQLVSNGVAKKLTHEEAVALIKELEKKGCVHTTYHYGNDSRNQAFVICNCCPDCCALYGTFRKGGLSKIHVHSYAVPQMKNEQKCVGCDRCGKVCPTGATYYDRIGQKLVFNYEKCIGCGQCVHQCKFDVREMVDNERDVFVKTEKPKGK